LNQLKKKKKLKHLYLKILNCSDLNVSLDEENHRCDFIHNQKSLYLYYLLDNFIL